MATPRHNTQTSGLPQKEEKRPEHGDGKGGTYASLASQLQPKPTQTPKVTPIFQGPNALHDLIAYSETTADDVRKHVAKHESDLNALHTERGTSPFETAVAYGKPDVVEYFLSDEVKTSLDCSQKKDSILTLALMNPHKGVLKTLLPDKKLPPPGKSSLQWLWDAYSAPLETLAPNKDVLLLHSLNDGTTSTHLAAIRGEMENLKAILVNNPDRLTEVTVRGEYLTHWVNLSNLFESNEHRDYFLQHLFSIWSIDAPLRDYPDEDTYRHLCQLGIELMASLPPSSFSTETALRLIEKFCSKITTKTPQDYHALSFVAAARAQQATDFPTASKYFVECLSSSLKAQTIEKEPYKTLYRVNHFCYCYYKFVTLKKLRNKKKIYAATNEAAEQAYEFFPTPEDIVTLSSVKHQKTRELLVPYGIELAHSYIEEDDLDKAEAICKKILAVAEKNAIFTGDQRPIQAVKDVSAQIMSHAKKQLDKEAPAREPQPPFGHAQRRSSDTTSYYYEAMNRRYRY